jgi:hypothetical protein
VDRSGCPGPRRSYVEHDVDDHHHDIDHGHHVDHDHHFRQFLPVAGSSFTDSGTASCVAAGP